MRKLTLTTATKDWDRLMTSANFCRGAGNFPFTHCVVLGSLDIPKPGDFSTASIGPLISEESERNLQYLINCHLFV